MKLLTLLIASGLLLSSCTFGGNEKIAVPGASNDSVIQKQPDVTAVPPNSTVTPDAKPKETVAKEGSSVSVDYVGRLEDGSVFDSSIESEAKKAPTYSPDSGRKYEPFEVKLQADGGSIPGFWKGIIGMKIGETKKITIPAKDAYGPLEWIDAGDSIVDRKIFNDTIVQTVPKSMTLDIIKMDIPVSDYLKMATELPKIWQVLTNEKGIKATVDKIDDKNISVSIDNSKTNMFSGKKLEKGTELITEDGNPATITKVDKDNITLEIKNTTNPFSGKKLAVGLEGMYQEKKVKITKIDKEKITVNVQGKSHPLAGKTLVFEITLKEIN